MCTEEGKYNPQRETITTARVVESAISKELEMRDTNYKNLWFSVSLNRRRCCVVGGAERKPCGHSDEIGSREDRQNKTRPEVPRRTLGQGMGTTGKREAI
jgi:hypothetical protein